jgi:hypothetical protein
LRGLFRIPEFFDRLFIRSSFDKKSFYRALARQGVIVGVHPGLEMRALAPPTGIVDRYSQGISVPASDSRIIRRMMYRTWVRGAQADTSPFTLQAQFESESVVIVPITLSLLPCPGPGAAARSGRDSSWLSIIQGKASPGCSSGELQVHIKATPP